jgi:Skp family chaperone for outer membrane proteins
VKRSFVFLSAVVGFGGMLALASSGAQAQAPGGAPAPGAPPAAPTARPTVAVFNMAAVMRDYGKAKYQVNLLTEKRLGMSADIMKMKDEYIKLQTDAKNSKVPADQEKIGKRLVEIARVVEDREREINKVLNEDASKIISDLYDDIKRVVDKTAEMNGYHIVFAYPDAVTEDEMKNPYLKELKLKPPAAQPFYVARHVDLTGVVIETLNKWFPAVNAQGQPVDVSKLPQPGNATTGAPPAAGGAPAGAPPAGAIPGSVPGRP